MRMHEDKKHKKATDEKDEQLMNEGETAEMEGEEREKVKAQASGDDPEWSESNSNYKE